MNFEFATAARIIFGTGRISELGPCASQLGKNALVVTGRNTTRATQITGLLEESGLNADMFSVPGEPTVKVVKSGVAAAQSCGTDIIIGFGGGSAIDAAKAIAALATNDSDPYEYLEVIGNGNPLTNSPLPSIAIPTTAGTGAEVTKNSVLASPKDKVKVSLRHPLMLPNVALVDPELTYSLPAHTTAFTGLDALTQLIEPYTSCRANPMTDGFCLEGISRAARSLQVACENGDDAKAREDMALASLLGGLALANSGLGMVHGFAGPLGGMFPAPHGAVCASLLPHVMRANVSALRNRGDEAGTLGRYETISRIVTGQADATIDDGVAWIEALCEKLEIPGIRSFGIEATDFPLIVENSSRSSSAKGNPISLTPEELTGILESAF